MGDVTFFGIPQTGFSKAQADSYFILKTFEPRNPKASFREGAEYVTANKTNLFIIK